MNKTKKIISLLLSLIMALSVFSIVPFTAGAAEAEVAETGAKSGTTGDCTWTLDDNGVLTISGNGEMDNYDDTYNGSWVTTAPWGGYSFNSVVIESGVTSIGEDAFQGCTGLKSVTIPVSVTSIGSSAFEDCTGLTSITIPDSVTNIGNRAFFDCTGLTSVTIGNSVTSIGKRAFSGCTGLTSVTIPDSVTNIGEYAFSGCTGLTSIHIPDSVTSIDKYAFTKCTGLKSVTIPDSVTSIGERAFEYCTGLTSITIPDSVTSIGWGAFSGCSRLTSVTIGNSVTSIGRSAFDDCTSLTSVTIPDSVTSIGYSAFSGCTGLTSVTIPDSVTSIGKYAFTKCTGLTNVTIPDSVTSIGGWAFSGCTGLTSVTIPDSVTSIGTSAFEYTAWYNNQPDGLVYAGKVAYGMKGSCSSEVVIKDGTVSITAYAFSGCSKLTSINIPDSVTSIGYEAFSSCWRLTSIDIPDSVTSIGGEAFEGCTGLTSITIPDSVTSIGEKAFGYYYDRGYKKISGFKIYGNKDTEAEKYAKENGFSFIPIIGLCNKCKAPIPVSNIDVKYDTTCTEDGIAYWHCGKCGELGESVLPALGHDYKAVVTHPTCIKDGYTTHTCSRCKDSYKDNQVKALGHDYHTVVTPPTCTKDGGTSHTCSRCKDTYVTDQVKALGHDYHQVSVTPPTCTEDGYTTYTCSRCNDTYVTDKVAALGHDYDLNVKKDPTATLPGIMTAECKRCPEKKNVVLPALNEEDYTLTKTAETGKATYTLKDKTYGVYKTVADAPEGWYASGTTGDCTWVKEGSVLTISVTDPSVNSFDKGTANYNNTSPAPWKDSDITDVIINEGVTRIGSYAFCECKKLKSVSISDTVTTIGFSAFYDCTSLTDVKMPNSLWYTGDSVFNGCTSLKNITIPNSISKIESFTFARSGLTNITIPESVYSIQDYAFSSCRDLKSVTILNPHLVVYKDQTNFSGTQKALGWYIDDYGDDKKIPDFTIYGYKGSNVEKFANNNSFKFIGLDQKTDSATGISVVIPESHNIRVKELTEKNGISAVNDMLYGCKATKAYDIEVTQTIYVVSYDNPSQLLVDKPGNNMQIKIPCADKTATVYRKEKDGGFTKINAIYEDGYMVIYTDRAGTFALTVPCKTALGDVDGNEEVDVKDATWIQRLVAGIEIPFTVDDKYADIDGDGEVNIMDATAIQYYLIKSKNPYKIGQSIA